MKRTLSLLVFLLVISPAVSIAETKIATADVNRILNESPDARAKRKELDVKVADLKKKIDAKKATLSDLEKKLKEKKVSETSSEAESFRNQVREFERFVRDSDEDLKKEFLKVNKTLSDKVLGVVAAYAKENKIDIVFDRGDKVRGAVLYGDAATDITDEIIKKIP